MDVIRRTVSDPRIIEAFEVVDRRDFLPEEVRDRWYVDAPLPIGWGQTTSQPSLMAKMVEALELEPRAKVLEVGAGCGFLTAILSYLCKDGKVVAIERIRELYEMAKRNLAKYPFTKNVRLVLGSGARGFAEEAPYDAILVSAAAGSVPRELLEQLKTGGKCVIPVEHPLGGQILYRIVRKDEREFTKEPLEFVSFVPLIDEEG